MSSPVNGQPQHRPPSTNEEWIHLIRHLTLSLKVRLPEQMWVNVDMLIAACENYAILALTADIAASAPAPTAEQAITLINESVDRRFA